MPSPEQRLWAQLRADRLGGWHFRRQHPVGPYIVDFLCAKALLVIEVDGDSHAEQAVYDEERTRWLTSEKHYRVLRFTNRAVMQNLNGVLEAIQEALAQHRDQPSP
ncbi:MAG: endonuclease domain-containing protein [Chloroflexi bacterium]|nr:endonuclease domain-containing protein [Chloroflexota bacterium]